MRSPTDPARVDSGPGGAGELPPILQQALARLDPQVAPPAELDRRILGAAEPLLAALRGQQARRARRRRWIVLASAPLGAAAGFLFLIFSTWRVPQEARPAAGSLRGAPIAREDLDRNGRVDILDAFQLARELAAGGPGGPGAAQAPGGPGPRSDFTRDGRVDQADVDYLARLAVRLGT